MKVLITSGGTKVGIDRVRSITNMSHGTFGNHMAHAWLSTGHDVIFLHARGSLTPHEFRWDLEDHTSMDGIRALIRQQDFLDDHRDRYTPIQYQDFRTFKEHFLSLLTQEKPDVAILAAAVSDYEPVEEAPGKISSELETMDIRMRQTPKLIRQVKGISPGTFLVGFKLLVGSTPEQLLGAMEKQMAATGADMIVGNDLTDIQASSHTLTLMLKGGHTDVVKGYPGETLAAILTQRVKNAYASQVLNDTGKG